jgi:glutamate dehydrogenase/leucine dehydrogenase
MFDKPAFAGHECVHHFFDVKTGLRAIIALHATALGPAAGGCRMWNYATADDALIDALRLSQGMSYKNAMADLPLGGGKAVIWGNSRTDKTPDLFRALGRAINSLNGRYWSAEDVGVSVQDMAFAAEKTKFVSGLYTGKAATLRALGTDDLSSRTIAVQGVGHVGSYLCGHLAKAGANLVITDLNAEALHQVAHTTGAQIVAPAESMRSPRISSHRTPSVRSSTLIRCRACASASSLAARTTSSPRPKRAIAFARWASSTRPTTSSMAGESSTSPPKSLAPTTPPGLRQSSSD